MSLTQPQLHKMVDAYELAAPVTHEDCKEIYNDIKPLLAAGVPLTVLVPLGSSTLRVEVGMPGTMHVYERSF